MGSISETKLDKRDKKILYLLDLNGRSSYSEIARKTKISKQLAKYRIERLESAGVIKGYYPMVDTSRLGFTTFRVYLKFKNTDEEKKNRIIKYCVDQKQIWAVVSLAGKWNLALGISVTDIYQFYKIWEDLLKEWLPYIKESETHIYSPIFHYSKAYILDKKDISKVRILGGKDKAEYDSKDIQIMQSLAKDARKSLLQISSEVKQSAEFVSYRVKQLEKKGIIQGYRAMIDVAKLGYHFFKAEIRLFEYDKYNSILTFCHQHPNIYQVDKNIGGEMLDVEFHVKNLQEMLNIISEMQKVFPNTIESFDYITVLSEEKTVYMPSIH